jgi:glutamate dehydrogenase
VPETGDASGQDAVLREVATHTPEDARDAAVAFARAALRRVPAEQLRAADPEAVAAGLADAYAFLAEGHEAAVRIFTPAVGLDPRGAPTTVVQLHSHDRPFLLATLTEHLEERGLGIVRTLHPIVGVERDEDGRVVRVHAARDAAHRESFLHLELDRVLDDDTAAELTQVLHDAVADVFAATDDHAAMREAVVAMAETVRDEARGHADDEEIEETASLLAWLLDGNIVLLGVRSYEIVDLADGTGRGTRIRPGSGLGILREDPTRELPTVPLSELPDEQRERYLSGRLLRISRTNRLATVQRRARMDYVGITRYGPDGEVVGEFRVLGLFTRKAYGEPARTTPVLRHKLRRILELEDVVPGSHDEATLVGLFQALPKDELFQADLPTLHAMVVDLFQAEEQRQVRVTVRTDAFTRTVSVVVSVPRDRYGPELRRRFTQLLTERYRAAHVEVDLSLDDRRDAVARFAVQVADHRIPDVPVRDLRQALHRMTRSWLDDLSRVLDARVGEAERRRLVSSVGTRLPQTYRDAADVATGIEDVLALDALLRDGDDLRLRVVAAADGSARIRAYRSGPPLELSSFLPLLENIGLLVAEEVPHRLEGDDPLLHLHDFGVRDARGVPVDVEADGERLAAAVLAAWRGEAESDSLARLVLTAGLTWREVAILRAYRRYRRQVGTAYTPEYVSDALASHPEAVRRLVDHVAARFDPEQEADEATLARTRAAVLAACDAIDRLDHDRILRGMLALVDATLRTNAYRDDAWTEGPDGVRVPYLSFKFDPSAIPDMPLPVPHREIFVHGPTVEGIHLRGGAVARGGLRWSDRLDDVRTEVLGLMKAQMLKNAVIVPAGAKGGFVVKRPPAERDALREEVARQYVTFVRGLLDVTDDLDGDRVVPPPRVRRYDGDDPYLVVAADKGTATFSDLANSVAEQYGFWLGDAFASGGSNGYDHKALGITARGAWVAVRRHFLELGIHPELDPVSVVGVGDMSGDVFGNGLLSSREFRLVAAFDHRDVFLDPDPDPHAAFEERKRLFELPGSSWQDYDRERISAGGGVFPRSAKSVELSDEVRRVLRVDDATLSPDELIRAILRAPVDLLWAGGIGTYVKASTESHADVGDRTNDEVRVDASELRARVFGEGANLSITQAGRIQYARRGGRIDQDAVHNAGGVDCSDHEVNVKILLRLAVEEGRLDEAGRVALLEEVTEDVVAHVLRDVDLQTWCLSAEAAASPARMGAYEHLLRVLEEQVGLDRQVEGLPGREELEARADEGAGLTRPELATVVGYAKRLLTDVVLDSPLVDAPAVAPVLEGYFPPALVERFGDLLPRHRLRGELVATLVSNDVVNRMGPTFVHSTAAEAGATPATVVAAWWTARELVGAEAMWTATEPVLDLVGPERQAEIASELRTLLAELTRRYIADVTLDSVDHVITRDRDVADVLLDALTDLGTPDQVAHRRDRASALVDDLIDPELAAFVANTRDMTIVGDVAATVRDLGQDAADAGPVADATLRLTAALGIDRLLRLLDSVEVDTPWARLQRTGIADDLRLLRRIGVAAALDGDGRDPVAAVERFVDARPTAMGRLRDTVREAERTHPLDLDAIAVATRMAAGVIRS